MKIREIIEKELREKTQTRLAADLHISQATIYKILNTDTKPNIDTIKKIARYTGYPVTHFLGIEDTKAGSSDLSTDERKILTIYRQLNALGVSHEAMNYFAYLLDKTRQAGKTIKKQKNLT